MLQPRLPHGHFRAQCARYVAEKFHSKSVSIARLRRRYFCCLAGAVGEHMFELRDDADLSQGSSEFVLDATGSIKAAAAEIARQKNKKQRGGFAFFGYFFGEAKK